MAYENRLAQAGKTNVVDLVKARVKEPSYLIEKSPSTSLEFGEDIILIITIYWGAIY